MDPDASNQSPEAIPPADAPTSAPDLPVNESTETNMEVHYHPHSAPGHKKTFKEYLSDFLMIFLAVTLGFFAESFREHLSEKSKEKEYVHNLLADLRKDTADLSVILFYDKEILKGLDSVADLADLDFSLPDNRLKLYRIASKSFNSFSQFMVNDVTLQQIKFSGDLKLLNRQHAADSVITYYAGVGQNKAQENTNTALFMDIIKIMDETFNYTVLYGKELTGPGPYHIIPPLRNPDRVATFFNKLQIYKEVLRSHDANTRMYSLEPAKRLIAFLEKEYHLEQVDGKHK